MSKHPVEDSNMGNDNSSGVDNEIPDGVLALGFAAVPKRLADRVVFANRVFCQRVVCTR